MVENHLLAFLSSCLAYHRNKWSRASPTSAGLAWNPGTIPSPPVLSHLLLAGLKVIQLLVGRHDTGDFGAHNTDLSAGH